MELIGRVVRQLLVGGFLILLPFGWPAKIPPAPALPPYSTVAQVAGASGPTGLITLPGLNDAQQTMAQSINNVCPTINTIALTADQKQLAQVCAAMTGTAVQLQGQANPLALPSYGISAGQLNSALQSLNGGAE